MTVQQAIAAGVIDRHVTQDTRKTNRRLVPVGRTMTKVDCRHPWEMQQGGHRLHMVMSVDQIRRRCKLAEIVDDEYVSSPQFSRHFTQYRALDNRLVFAFLQAQRSIAHIELRAAAAGERVVGKEDSQTHS